MTPAIAPPLVYRTPTASAAIVVSAPAYIQADADPTWEPDFPQGINYDRWTGVVQTSPRDTFADRLDLLDLLDD